MAYAILAGGTGEKIARMLQSEGIDVEAITVEGETRTNLKVVDDVLGTNTDINEPGPKTSADDADGDPLRIGIKARPSLIKPNDDELSHLVGRELASDAEVAEAARQLVSGGVEEVVVSMGGRGAFFATKDKVILAKAPKVKVGSTIGAGDSVVAALALAEIRGMGLEDAARLAVATGSANVMYSGTQAAEKSAVEALMPGVQIEELA